MRTKQREKEARRAARSNFLLLWCKRKTFKRERQRERERERALSSFLGCTREAKFIFERR